MDETQTGKRIKFIHSDNGTEYCNKEFDKYLQDWGIGTVAKRSCGEEESNSFRYGNDSCMLMQGDLRTSAAANHIRNRSSSSSINGDTPFKLWTNKRPNVSYFRTFGCKALFLDKSVIRSTFQTLAKPCIFV